MADTERPLRIALFNNSTWGLYNFRKGVIEELVSRGYEVHTMAPFDDSYDNETYVKKLTGLGTTFHRITQRNRNKNPLFELWSLQNIFRTIWRIRPDVLLTYTIKCNLYSGFCRRLFAFRQIANISGLGEAFDKKGLIQSLVFWMYKFAFAGIDAVFFQNREDLKFCTRYRLVERRCCGLLPGSGVALAHFTPSYPVRSPGKRIFLMFGRLLPQKGYYEFLATAAALREHHGPTAEFWIQGMEDRNRPDSATLLHAIKAADSAGWIRFVPPAADVRATLEAVDVAVLPSTYNEGIPRSLLEAMACGKPIITTDWKGCRETVPEGKNGILISSADPQALTNAVETMLSATPEALLEMGRHSRRTVEETYDERLVVERYLAVITAPTNRAGELADAASPGAAFVNSSGCPLNSRG